MPQAMPLNWLNLFFIMLMLFLLINIKMYFSYKKTPIKKINLFFKKLNWKW